MDRKPNRSALSIYRQGKFYLIKPHKHSWRGIELMNQLFDEYPNEEELVEWGREILEDYYLRNKGN